MTSGERRLAERLEHKLDDDYLLWYDVPVGPQQLHPDFIVLHPSRGLLILEVKDFRLSTIVQADKDEWTILDNASGGPKHIQSPFAQARNYAHAVLGALRADKRLVHPDGRRQGEVVFAWSYGVVLPNITRRQFTDAQLDKAIAAHRVICSDEMTESVDAEVFQSRLWEMFPYERYQTLTLPQIDRVRWILFPQVRIPDQASLFDEADMQAEVPDMLRVMDLQQEQLARSLGDGHRVIHGVAGSGKTMILGYRAEYLARATAAGKPVLVLCYNEPLAVKLAATLAAKGLGERVHCVHFHKWARAQLVAYGQGLPANNLPQEAFFADMVQRVITGVERGHIPTRQYLAVLIDEGHDFAPEWLKLVTQMVDPTTNTLLVLYDDAQSIYDRGRKKNFSFKSVGIQAQGRTTILKINYRNTRQILQTANAIAGDLLTAEDRDDDGIPLVKPVSCGRDGPEPIIINLLTLPEQAAKIAELLQGAHADGFAWGDMAVLCRDAKTRDLCASTLAKRGLPVQNRLGVGDYDPLANSVKVMTMKVSKGLEFPVVAISGVGALDPAHGAGKCAEALSHAELQARREAARVLYVAATRATQRLALVSDRLVCW
ncbi:DNA helicase II [Acidovorax carolinensis]|uniref:DNA helicase II n=2 Tax=Acidovorax carolinensis TaxID=553814 RepID=A0A240U776_9BURK|nr:DNA helicase II [Acidovorax carolinensis]